MIHLSQVSSTYHTASLQDWSAHNHRHEHTGSLPASHTPGYLQTAGQALFDRQIMEYPHIKTELPRSAGDAGNHQHNFHLNRQNTTLPKAAPGRQVYLNHLPQPDESSLTLPSQHNAYSLQAEFASNLRKRYELLREILFADQQDQGETRYNALENWLKSIKKSAQHFLGTVVNLKRVFVENKSSGNISYHHSNRIQQSGNTILNELFDRKEIHPTETERLVRLLLNYEANPLISNAEGKNAFLLWLHRGDLEAELIEDMISAVPINNRRLICEGPWGKYEDCKPVVKELIDKQRQREKNGEPECNWPPTAIDTSPSPERKTTILLHKVLFANQNYQGLTRYNGLKALLEDVKNSTPLLLGTVVNLKLDSFENQNSGNTILNELLARKEIDPTETECLVRLLLNYEANPLICNAEGKNAFLLWLHHGELEAELLEDMISAVPINDRWQICKGPWRKHDDCKDYVEKLIGLQISEAKQPPLIPQLPGTKPLTGFQARYPKVKEEPVDGTCNFTSFSDEFSDFIRLFSQIYDLNPTDYVSTSNLPEKATEVTSEHEYPHFSPISDHDTESPMPVLEQ